MHESVQDLLEAVGFLADVASHSCSNRPATEQANRGPVAWLTVRSDTLGLGMDSILLDYIKVGLHLNPIRRRITPDRNPIRRTAVLVEPVHGQPTGGVLFVHSDQMEPSVL